MISIVVGILLLVLALQDAFEAIVLPRRVTRKWRLVRAFYRLCWPAWRWLCDRLPTNALRENVLSVFGPLSLLTLFAFWSLLLIVGFALIHWGAGTLPGDPELDLRQALYNSGETFFTLGYGDITPRQYGGKLLAVIEAGTGFGFMALVIGYLPVLYQAFSRREQMIALLDARCGSPPTASELLRRFGYADGPGAGLADNRELERFLVEWELWAADLLESHLSFPVLVYYRSQHDNQSWLAALALVLDVSATLIVAASPPVRRRAELTFAMTRHACVDLCLVFWLPPREPPASRLSVAEVPVLITSVRGADGRAEPQNPAVQSPESGQRLAELRSLYEPFLATLSDYFCVSLTRFFPERPKADNWQTTAWSRRAPGITDLASTTPSQDHFG